MSSSNHSVGIITHPESPAATHQRRAMTTVAQMDAVGRFDSDDDDDDEANDVVAIASQKQKEKQTPPPSPPSKNKTNTTSSGGNVEMAATVDVGRPVSMEIGHAEDEEEEEDHDFDADLERLLGDTTTTTTSSESLRRGMNRRCCSCYKIGATRVLCPNIHDRTGFGLIGPHWFGPICTMALVLWGGHHFINKANDIGLLTHWTCIAFTILTATLLVAVACSDPGIVRDSKPPDNSDEEEEEWRWCDFCSVYQPPDGAHCPDCKVCVEGYDHHCVWMGTCIGKGNFGAFKLFNLSWLAYLIYAIAWVTIIGPGMFGKDNDEEGEGE